MAGLKPCSADSCNTPAERGLGSCMIWAKHWCVNHAGSDAHKCPRSDTNQDDFSARYEETRKKHLDALLSKINVDALKAVASHAHHGLSCRTPALQDPLDPASRLSLVSAQCGGQNCHVDVDFEGGTSWIARIRLEDPLLPPPAVQDYIFSSEVATLNFLANTSVPCPRVHAYNSNTTENPVGTSHVLMDKWPGATLDWNRCSKEQKAKVMNQMADIFFELENHPVQMTGSLIQAGDGTASTVTVGPFAQTPWFDTPDSGLGPFDTIQDAYKAVIELQLRIIARREISDLPVDNYLSMLWRLSHLQELSSMRESTITQPQGASHHYYLKHFDDKGDHILVDDDYNITGIIDWEFASCEAKELAFSSPCMMWPVGDFYDGHNNLSEDEVAFADILTARGRSDMAKLVVEGRRWQRYLFFLGGGYPSDLAEFKALFHGLRQSFLQSKGEPATGDGVPPYDEWKRDVLSAEYTGDSVLLSLLTAQDAE